MSEDIGYRLRRAREARGLTVDEVADRIRIKKSYVTAMEQGQFDALPSPFYVRSYLRAYARFLGLDASAILRGYREQAVEQGNFEHSISRRWSRELRRSSGRDEEGYRQWPLPEREKDRESSSLTGKDRDRDRERHPSESEPSENVPYRSTDLRGKSQGWTDVSREDDYHAEPFSAEPDSNHHVPPPSHPTTPSRGPSMPKDVPSPSEIGLPRRSVESSGGHALPTVVRERNEQTEIPHLSRRRKAASKEKNGTFGKWYNRFLIAGTVLLIPAALTVGFLIWGEENPPANAGDNTEVSRDNRTDPLIYPTETSNSGPDHFELTQANKIELKIDAEGECWIELRGQEVGKKLKEVTLESGSPPFAYETENEDLWVELKPSNRAKISVNGEQVGEYKKQKAVHIRLVK